MKSKLTHQIYVIQSKIDDTTQLATNECRRFTDDEENNLRIWRRSVGELITQLQAVSKSNA